MYGTYNKLQTQYDMMAPNDWEDGNDNGLPTEAEIIAKYRAGKKYELHFVAKFPIRVFETLLEAQQFIHRVHPMAYVGQV